MSERKKLKTKPNTPEQQVLDGNRVTGYHYEDNETRKE